MLLKEYAKQRKLIAAICAAPIALVSAQLTKDKRITSHPSVSAEIKECKSISFYFNLFKKIASHIQKMKKSLWMRILLQAEGLAQP